MTNLECLEWEMNYHSYMINSYEYMYLSSLCFTFSHSYTTYLLMRNIYSIIRTYLYIIGVQPQSSDP